MTTFWAPPARSTPVPARWPSPAACWPDALPRWRACQALAEDFTPLSDFRASKEYRLLTAQNLLRKYFIEQQTPHIETRVTAYV